MNSYCLNISQPHDWTTAELQLYVEFEWIRSYVTIFLEQIGSVSVSCKSKVLHRAEEKRWLSMTCMKDIWSQGNFCRHTLKQQITVMTLLVMCVCMCVWEMADVYFLEKREQQQQFRLVEVKFCFYFSDPPPVIHCMTVSFLFLYSCSGWLNR